MDCKSSPSSSSQPIWKYHVFLSFNPEDTSYDFTSYLYFSLLTNGLKTLVHEDKKQEYTSPKLLKEIEQSMISIVVFSRNYVASTSRLDELAKIAEHFGSSGMTVFPVFYDLDPSVVRHQIGVYQQAFAEYEERFKHKVKRWRQALTKLANLSGWVVQKENRERREAIYDIVRRAKYILGIEVSSSVKDELVGIQAEVEALEKLVELDSNDVIQVIGICGMRGSGKTTLASLLYHKFDASCFLHNVSRVFTTPNGISTLRQQLLRETLREENLSISDVHQGTTLIATRLRNLKILIVLDDVRYVQILKELVGNHDQFGAGSRIIITTRDNYVLEKYGVDKIYEVKVLSKEMTEEEAFQLFTSNSLSDMEKEIFLDIASFFVDENINNLMEILCECEFYSTLEIEALIKKSLMTVSHQKIQMHYMLQELGQKIIRLEFPEEPGKRSRLWFDEDFRTVIETNTGTENIKALVLNPRVSEEKALRVDALSKMNGLKLLIIRNVKFSGVLNGLSNHLQYVLWHKFPFTSLPSSFEPNKLFQLIMPDSNITQLWKESKTLPNLRSLDLHGSKNLMKTPDFQRLLNLERLDLEGCVGLVVLDPSIAFLAKLKFLNLRNCTSLVTMPNNLFGLSSLEILNVAGCSKFAECLVFDDWRSSSGGEVHNQDFPLLEEIGKPLFACGIKVNSCMNVGVCANLDEDDIYSKKEARSSQTKDASKVCVSPEIKEDTHLAMDEKYTAKSTEATSSTIITDEYLIKCIEALDEIDGVSDNSYMKALEKFKDSYWRQVFLTMSNKRKKAWLNNLV